MDRYDALSMMRRVWNLLDQESLVVEAGIKISGPFYFHFYIYDERSTSPHVTSAWTMVDG